MRDYKLDFEVEGKTYSMIFNLNVMQAIQEEYGTVQAWGNLTDGKSEEINAKALIFGLAAMINEGIEINNDEKGLNEPILTEKQVGRLITKMGLKEAASKLNKAVIEGTKNDTPKNE